ncbi:hypothetical protein Q5P01_020694 [Channa striata]|uniref:Glycosyltransferase family 92 protein n=1 Tax=Channa striata TaxID=64152 RepID=A0AA88S9A6_CHASR|nr:hypothetical protein Q5P01_020694 [Channa striata]
MARKKLPNKKVLFVFISVVTVLLFLVRNPRSYGSIPTPLGAEVICPHQVSEQTITPLNNTKHFLVSAYMDERVNGFSLRIIGIFRRDSIQPLDCVFCCSEHNANMSLAPATISPHSDHFGFPYCTTDVMCQIPQNCNATHVTLVTGSDEVKGFDQIWLPIRNKKTNRKEENKPQFDFTVCVSSLFGDYNNVLQFAQTLEVYRLLGVNRVVIYNTSCGPDLERLLQSYSQEGFVELVPWPIDRYLNPSPGWLFSQHGGDVHYFGQLTTLNECIYRSMDRSRYVLLNDIDEIIMPHQHRDLKGLMDMLNRSIQMLLGVNRVVIYKTSCGPDLERLLQSYSQEGFVELVPWPIDRYLNPSPGWLFSQHGGDVHYFGQLTTLNECIYRSMDRSRYVLLNDIDEIIMPYQHRNLKGLMDMLQQKHPNTGVFLIENHIFPKKHFEPSRKFNLPQWKRVPGVNILEHIYREDPDRNISHPHKMIVQPKMVEQTSVHNVPKYFGESYKVPLDVCRIIHVRVALRGSLLLEQLNVDKRLWDFQEKLISKTDEALKRAGLL